MADEAKIRISLAIDVGNLSYRSSPQSFTMDVSSSKGPAPGVVAVSTTGVSIDLSQLTTPALCWMRNLDLTNFVEYGRYDGTTFHPCGELLAGDFVVFRLARNITTLRLRANTAACNVRIEAFSA